MTTEPIKTEQEYLDALNRLEVIFDARQNTDEGDELEMLGLLIDNFEKIHFPLGLPDAY